MTRDELSRKIEEVSRGEFEVLLADGFEDAFLGLVTVFDSQPVACYDRVKCLQILEAKGMSPEEAQEFFSFNVEGAYVGEATPCFLDRLTEDEEQVFAGGG